MKIIEAQNAVLTNYEVYTHLIESESRFSARHKKEHRRPPKNYQAVTKDVGEDGHNFIPDENQTKAVWNQGGG